MSLKKTSAPSFRQSALVQAFKRLAPGGVCFDPWSAGRIRSLLALSGGVGRIVDVGSSTRVLDARIIRFDIDHGAGVTVIGDGHEMPFASGVIDAIVLTGVLEHVLDPPTLVAEAYRVLRSGGRVYVEVPFLQGYHPHPGDYQRYTKTGLQRLMRSFREIDCGVCGGAPCG